MTLWLWIAIAVVVLACGALLPVLVTRRRGDAENERISARARYSKLEHYVNPPPATDSPEAAEALRRAQERWHSAGQVLADATKEAEFKLAGQIAQQGLSEVTEAYERIGLPGPR